MNNRKRILILIAVLFFAGPLRRLLSGGIPGLMDAVVDTLYTLPAIAIALSFHEYGHAIAANYWGDDTPARDGRLTVDPRAHVDLMGILCLLFFRFGWGKPVRINPQRFRNRHTGIITVGLAGIAMNFVLALIFGGIIKLLYTFAIGFLATKAGGIILTMALEVVYINLSLMFFNLLPIPPLDGFNVVSELFHLYDTKFYMFMRSYSTWILLAVIFLDIPSYIIPRLMSATANFIFHTVFAIF